MIFPTIIDGDRRHGRPARRPREGMAIVRQGPVHRLATGHEGAIGRLHQADGEPGRIVRIGNGQSARRRCTVGMVARIAHAIRNAMSKAFFGDRRHAVGDRGSSIYFIHHDRQRLGGDVPIGILHGKYKIVRSAHMRLGRIYVAAVSGNHQRPVLAHDGVHRAMGQRLIHAIDRHLRTHPGTIVRAKVEVESPDCRRRRRLARSDAQVAAHADAGNTVLDRDRQVAACTAAVIIGYRDRYVEAERAIGAGTLDAMIDRAKQRDRVVLGAVGIQAAQGDLNDLLPAGRPDQLGPRTVQRPRNVHAAGLQAGILVARQIAQLDGQRVAGIGIGRLERTRPGRSGIAGQIVLSNQCIAIAQVQDRRMVEFRQADGDPPDRRIAVGVGDRVGSRQRIQAMAIGVCQGLVLIEFPLPGRGRQDQLEGQFAIDRTAQHGTVAIHRRLDRLAIRIDRAGRRRVPLGAASAIGAVMVVELARAVGQGLRQFGTAEGDALDGEVAVVAEIGVAVAGRPEHQRVEAAEAIGVEIRRVIAGPGIGIEGLLADLFTAPPEFHHAGFELAAEHDGEFHMGAIGDLAVLQGDGQGFGCIAAILEIPEVDFAGQDVIGLARADHAQAVAGLLNARVDQGGVRGRREPLGRDDDGAVIEAQRIAGRIPREVHRPDVDVRNAGQAGGALRVGGTHVGAVVFDAHGDGGIHHPAMAVIHRDRDVQVQDVFGRIGRDRMVDGALQRHRVVVMTIDARCQVDLDDFTVVVLAGCADIAGQPMATGIGGPLDIHAVRLQRAGIAGRVRRAGRRHARTQRHGRRIPIHVRDGE
ncbi:hypothetical protein CDEN61S_01534 [Castellaniella denitrificans]